MTTTGAGTGTATSYPLQLTFKIVAVAPQIAVTDSSGRLLLYVKQKAFKLKEKVTVFGDREQARPLYTIGADRIIDFSAEYRIATAAGAPLGSLKRRGMRSLWRAQYDVLRDGATVQSIREANPWIKVIDGLVGEIPVLSLLTGHFFHPAYLLSRAGGEAILRVQKQAAFFESRYVVTRMGDLSQSEEELALLAILMMLLLERTRG